MWKIESSKWDKSLHLAFYEKASGNYMWSWKYYVSKDPFKRIVQNYLWRHFCDYERELFPIEQWT